MASTHYYPAPAWTSSAYGVCGEYCDPRWFSTVRLWRKLILWSVGCYLVLNQGFMMVRIPPVGAGVPVGELMLVLSLILINLTVVLPRMSREVWIFPMLLWWGYAFSRVMIDVKAGGVWTFRDASQEIESLYLILGFWLIDSVVSLQYFFSWLRQVLLVLGIYSLTFPVSTALQKYSPSLPHMNARESSLLFQMVNIPNLALWSATWLLLESRGKSKPGVSLRQLAAAVIVAVAAAFGQSRTVYIQILALGILFLFLRRKMAVRWGAILLAGVVLIGGVSASGISLTGRLGEKVSLDFLARHLESSTGEGDAATEGAAGGVNLRKGWWMRIASEMRESPKRMAFGLGYGIPLTDYAPGGVQIREPHDSYISVWARLGAVGLVVWLMMQCTLYRAWWKSYQLCRRMHWIRDQQNLFLLLVFSVLSLVFATGEDAFEKPYVAIPYYLFFGVVLRYSKYLREAAAQTVPTQPPT